MHLLMGPAAQSERSTAHQENTAIQPVPRERGIRISAYNTCVEYTNITLLYIVILYFNMTVLHIYYIVYYCAFYCFLLY